tara:strand:+ start:377 stop:568 length:192 start_codon:yes stop_codon:yes gene_type:complete
MSDRRKVATTVYLTKEQAELLKILTQRTGVSTAHYIRAGVDLILEQMHDKLPCQMDLLDGDRC